MRLYCQQGFSSRIVQALRTRLERTLRMAAEEGHGHGGSSRIRSRSRGRGAEADAANLGPENSTVLDSTGARHGRCCWFLRQVLKWVMEPYLWQMDLCHQEEQCQKELIGSEDLRVFQQACKCK